jgi:hypothetical protein
MTNLKKSQKAFRPGDPTGLGSDEIELYNQMKERAEEIHCKPESCDGHSPPERVKQWSERPIAVVVVVATRGKGGQLYTL